MTGPSGKPVIMMAGARVPRDCVAYKIRRTLMAGLPAGWNTGTSRRCYDERAHQHAINSRFAHDIAPGSADRELIRTASRE